MKFKDHAALHMHTTRLQSASAALMACDAAMKEQTQVFDFAGQRFIGPDALLLKRILFEGLSGIADDATNALKKGGIVFDEPKPAKATRKTAKKAA